MSKDFGWKTGKCKDQTIRDVRRDGLGPAILDIRIRICMCLQSDSTDSQHHTHRQHRYIHYGPARKTGLFRHA